MTLELITTLAVTDALHAVRYGHSLATSPLLGIDGLTLRLRAEGLADTAQGRAWLLGQLLHDLADRQLSARRAAAAPTRPQAGTEAPDDLAQLAADYRAGDPELEAWSTLYTRYLAPPGRPFGEVPDLVGVPGRTLRRRLARGVEALAEALRSAELAAGRALAAPGDHAAYHRILVEPAAAPRDVLTLLGELLAALRSDAGVVRVSGDQLQAMAAYPASELMAWRLGRIAEWSQPRFRLDERFVALSLLVDLGEESASGRWRVEERRFTDLRDVLAEVSEPAVVLLGPPGSGKSTLLRRLELDLAAQGLAQPGTTGSAPLTLLVSLNQYKPATPGAPPPAPDAWLAERWARRYPKLPPLPELMAQGGVVLLLDGLNEMPHAGPEGYRERIGLWKQYLHETLVPGSGHRAVVACRSLDYSAPLSTPSLRVPQVRLEPLTDEQAQAFLTRYSPANAEVLWSELVGTPLLEALRWPYFLRLVVEDAAETGRVPEGLAALFTGLVRRALAREVERDNPTFAPGTVLSSRDFERVVSGRGWRSPYDLPEGGALFPALAGLAHGMQAEAVAGESSQARVRYEAALGMLPAVQAEEIVRAGVALGVVELDQATNEVFFSHQLVQEYFAGRRLAAEHDPERVAASWRVTDIRPGLREILDTLPPGETLPALPTTGWEETALLAATMVEQPEPFLRRLMPHNLVVAGRAANLPAVRPRLSTAFLDDLRWALVARSRDPEADLRARIDAGLALGWLGDPRLERRMGPDGPYLLPPLVRVPGGNYVLGDDEPTFLQDQTKVTNHIPRHTVSLAAFYVGCFPVTNAEWAHFMAAGGYEDERWWDTPDGRSWRAGRLPNQGVKRDNRNWRERFRTESGLLETLVAQGGFKDKASAERWQLWVSLDDESFEAALDRYWQPKRETEPRRWRDDRYSNPAQPVVDVCWFEARAFCAWLAAQSGLIVRLPTEAEWEAAARGPTGLIYPWGNSFDETNDWMRSNLRGTRIRRPTPVGVFPGGDSPVGAADVAGNVYEWTSSLLSPIGDNCRQESTFAYPYDVADGREDAAAPPSMRRVIRGGGFYNGSGGARAYTRDSLTPDEWHDAHGLRVAVDTTVAHRGGEDVAGPHAL